METKTIRQVLSNLPDEVRDMAIISAILAGGRGSIDEQLCFSCVNDCPEVSAILGSIDLERAIGGIDFWTTEVMRLRKDTRQLVHVQRNQVPYFLFLYEMAISNLPVGLIDPITLTTQQRLNTIPVLIETKDLEKLKSLGVKVNYNVVLETENLIWN